MSNNLMESEPGGPQTQYEATHTFVDAPAKQGGQLGDATAPSNIQDKSASNEPNTQGVTPADKIRYGQSIQEGGAGGKTMGETGHADVAGGFGDTNASQEAEDGFAKERREQGYGGAKDMDKQLGG